MAATPFSLLFFTLLFHIASAKSTVTAVLRDQLACTMCTTCDNPCDPVLYPPPPPSDTNIPPPQISYSPPPPSVPVPTPTVTYYSPPLPPSTSNGNGYNGGQYDPSQGGNFPTPPPPNPIMSYFPYYSNSSAGSGDRSVPMQSIVSTIILLIVLFIFL